MDRFHLYLIFLIYLSLPNQIFSQINFQSYRIIETGSEGSVVCIEDVTHDALKDVVMATGFYSDPLHDYKILVYRQNTDGELDPPQVYPYPEVYPRLNALTIDDVNNDALKDVIIAYGDSIGILFQNNAGTLNPIRSYFSGNSAYSIKTGDLNHDGLTDIAVSHWNEAFLRIFYQDAFGFNTHTYPKPQAGYDEIDVADMNDDGLEDVVFMAGQAEGGIHVFFQNDLGMLDPYVSYFIPGPDLQSLHGIALGDLNNDMRNDVVASRGGNSPTAKMVLWLQDPISGLLQSPLEIQAYDIPEPVEIADLNCDGHNEIITVHGGWNSMSVFEQDSAGHYESYLGFSIPSTSHVNPQGLSIGDINDDGREDIAIADFNVGLILLINNSLPLYFDEIDTSIVIETYYTDTILETFLYNTLSSDTIGNYLVTHIDSFNITQTFILDSVRSDSVYIRSAFFCSKPLSDTLVHSTYSFVSTLVSIDTLLISSHTDSIIITTGIQELESLIDFSLYPNPVQDRMKIQLTYPFEVGYSDITIYNILGELIYHDTIGNDIQSCYVDVGKYPDGLYIMNISKNGYSMVKKFIKTHM